MVDEIVETFESYFDKDQLTLKFPEVFAQMVNNDGTNADANDDAELEADDLPPLEQLDDDQPRQASVQAKTNFTD